MNKVSIRESNADDTQAIFELAPLLKPLTPHTKYTYWNLFTNFSNLCFIATEDDKPVGFITSHPTTSPPSEWFIWQAGISPEYRGSGLIDRLQDRVVDIASRSGALAIHTTIETDNPRSLGVFNRLATRLGTNMEQLESFSLDPNDPTVAEEVHYRIPLLT